MSEKILIIDDEARILSTFARLLKLDGYTVITAQDGTSGMACYEREHPAITFVDLRMPGKDGFQVLADIRAIDSDAEVILMTGHGDKETVIEALRADASDFISKPIEQVLLENVLRRAHERLQWKRELWAAQAALQASHANLEKQVAARTAELKTANATLQQRNQALQSLNAALQESELRFRSIFEQAAVGLCHSALDGTFIKVNQRFSNIVGYDQAELVKLTFQDITHPDDLKIDLSYVQQMLKGEIQSYALEKRYICKDAAIIWVNLTVALVRQSDGTPHYFIGVIEDITGRKQVEAALRESEERYRLIFHRSPVGIFHYDTKMCITDCNTRLAEILQSSRDSLLGFDMHSIRDTRILPALRRALKGKEGLYEGGYRATTGPAEVWAILRTAPLRNTEGQITGGIGIAEDITARKQAEDALRESEVRYRRLVEASPDIIYRLRLRPAIAFEYISPAVTTLMGYTPEAYYANPDLGYNLIHPEDRPKLDAILQNPERIPHPVTLRSAHRDGTPLWTEHHVTAIKNKTGETVALQGIARDVTEHQQIENAEIFLARSSHLTATGEDFFTALARYLAEALQMNYVLINRLMKDEARVETVAIHCEDHAAERISYDLANTPCGDVMDRGVCCFPQNVCDRFPEDTMLQDMDAESYVGVPLWGNEGMPIGLIAVVGRRPLAKPQLAEAILQLVAPRAASELERRQAEAALKESERRLDAILQTVVDGIVVVNLTGEIIYANHSAECILNVCLDAMVGKYYNSREWQQIDEHGNPFPLDQLPLAIALQEQREVGPIEHWIIASDGEKRWLSVNAAPLVDESGKLYGAVASFRDITELRGSYET